MCARMFGVLAVAALLAGCASNPAPATPQAKRSLDEDARSALASMKAADPGLQALLDNSDGYAIFPSIGAGGVIVGGAFGHGVVFEKGRMSGYVTLSQASVGAELGGQSYAELVVFRDHDAFWRLESGQLTFGAEASAVAIQAGAASGAQFTRGVATFIKPIGGLMANASLNGQQFNYNPSTSAQASGRD